MQSAYTAVLIASVPIQDLLFVVTMFTLAALALFVLAMEAGNYPKISAGIQRTRDNLHGLRNRRWQGKGIST